MRKVLLLGSSGKMGSAVRAALEGDYDLICKNSSDFDAFNFEQVRHLVRYHNPDIVINTVAFLGIDRCEKEPEKALLLNALYPRVLAELSGEAGFLLVHFSTDAVFDDTKRDYHVESDIPAPVNIYGFTKYGGDCLVSAVSKTYYIFRISVLFGETGRDTQFVEKMLKRIREGCRVLRISDDIVSSPSYSLDIAMEIKKILLDASLPYGIYHMANDGMASLYDLMAEIKKSLDLDVEIQRASYREFDSPGVKNTFTPIRSEKINPLRPWRDAVEEYCLRLEKTMKGSSPFVAESG